MTPEQQRIAIAEVCGWKIEKEDGAWCVYSPDGRSWLANTRDQPIEKLGVDWPDYINDLNAMHEAEEAIPHHLFKAYIEHLDVLTSAASRYFVLVHAASDQRAEAFLRVFGLWKD